MEGWVKFFSSQNPVVVSEEKGLQITIEANGDQDLNVDKMHNKSMKSLHTAHAN